MQNPKIHVRDYMRPVSHVFQINTSIEEIVRTLCKNKIVGAPVLNADKQLVGFITEQDCIKQMLNNTYYCDSHQVAGDIMRKNPLSVSPDYDVLHLAEDMTSKGPKIYPVIEAGKLVGLISRADVLKALSLATRDLCSIK